MVKSTPDYEPDCATDFRENSAISNFYPRSTNIECKEYVYISVIVRTQSPSFSLSNLFRYLAQR